MSNVGAISLGQDAETELRQISNRRSRKFYLSFVSNYLTEESESECVEYKVQDGEQISSCWNKLGSILMQRTGCLMQNSPRSSEDKAVVR